MFGGLVARGFTLWPAEVIGVWGDARRIWVMLSSVSIVTDPGADFVS